MNVSSSVVRRMFVFVMVVCLVASVIPLGIAANHATPGQASSADGETVLPQQDDAERATEREPNDDRANATPVPTHPDQISNVVGGSFSGTSNGTDEGTSTDPDVDFFAFNATEGEAVNLYTSSSTDVVDGVLYGPDGNVITTTQGGPDDIFTDGAVLNETGTYYFRVTANYTYDIRYDFGFQLATADSFEPNDGVDDATPIESGERVNGTIPKSDTDVFGVEAAPGENITARVELRDLPTDNPNNVAVDILGPSGERVSRSSGGPRGVSGNRTVLTGEDTPMADTASVNATVGDGGTYYVRVRGASAGFGDGGFAAYGLTVETDEANRPPTNNALVIVGGSAEHKVTYAFTYDGTVERSGESHGAPIDDDGVTIDPDVDTISDGRVDGRLGGGGDAYLVDGNVTGLRLDGDARVYLDGREVDPNSFGEVADRETATRTPTATATTTATPSPTATATATETAAAAADTASGSDGEVVGGTGTTTGDGPGFGVAITVLAVVVVALVASRRH